MNSPAIASRPGNASPYIIDEPLRFAGSALCELAVVAPVVLICRTEVVEPELLFTVPAVQAAPVGSPAQVTVIEALEKLLNANVVEPEPPGAETVTAAGFAAIEGVTGAPVATVNVTGAESNGV